MKKPNITANQMVKSSEVAKRFGEARRKAKEAPLFVTENGTVDTVIMDYYEYEAMYEFIAEIEEMLDEIVIVERAQDLEINPDMAVSWRSVRRL